MESLNTAISCALAPKPTYEKMGTNSDMRVATDDQIQAALFLLSKTKHAHNVSTEQDARAFFSIYIRGLRGFSIEAIREAVDFFFYDDPRDEKIKGLFPQPDEIKRAAVDATASILWRREQGKKIIEQTQAIKTATPALPPAPKYDPWEPLSKDQVVLAGRLIRNNKNMTPEQARDEVLGAA